MVPQPYGDDSAYTFYPVPDVSWLLDRESATERHPISTRWNLYYYFREYVLSNAIFALLFSTLFLQIWIRRTWEVWLDTLLRINVSLKRGLDVAGGALGLIMSLPFFLVLPIVIKLDSPGPVFFHQERVGINRRRRSDGRSEQAHASVEHRGCDRRLVNAHGRPFEIIKFRTMIHGAEKKCGPIWATANDPRITRFGKFMRKTRLDEIPQLWNVLKGEMSLVGPRPERLHFVEKLSREVPGFLDRLYVAPGITGLAQVKNGYDTSVESVHRKISHDLSYIRGWNIMKDLRILYLTVIVVITGRGAC
jgi:lipopolysaccharide/colanic/teichoic acid biosynthesis glycosyltransferase